MNDPLLASPTLLKSLTPTRRRQGTLLIALMILGALVEFATVVVVVPFLALVAGRAQGSTLAIMARVSSLLGVSSLGPVTAAGLLLALIAIGSAAVRLLLLYASQSFIFNLGLELSTRTYAAVLHQPLSYHLQRNSSAAIVALQSCTALIRDFLLPAMQGLVAVVIALAVMVAMLIVSPGVALVSVAAAGLMYGAVALLLGARLRRAGRVIAAAQAARLKTVQEGIGGIRDVLIGRAQPVYLDAFDRHNQELGSMLKGAAFAAHAPRLLIETAGMIGLALLAASMSHRAGGLVGSLPQLAALALGLLKLVPLFGQAFYGWAQAKSNRAVLADVLAYLALPMPQWSDTRLLFDRDVELRAVDFAYDLERTPTLSGVDLKIVCGEIIGLVGRTGSGKSTLLDIILGLLEPSAGGLYVDGRQVTFADAGGWQRNVAHVPQAIYLLDSSIADNIVLGTGAIDAKRLNDAVERAQLAEFIAQLPEGYDTRVGERGIRLSGGQRQRIGIARALYRGARLLVLDEATSALDEETESAVLHAICTAEDRPTVLIAAHRSSTLRFCSRIFRVSEGTVSQEPVPA